MDLPLTPTPKMAPPRVGPQGAKVFPEKSSQRSLSLAQAALGRLELAVAPWGEVVSGRQEPLRQPAPAGALNSRRTHTIEIATRLSHACGEIDVKGGSRRIQHRFR